MDYYVQNEEFKILVECKKNQIKEQILKSYVALRKQKGLTQYEIARRTGIKRANIARIEGGKYVPTIEVLVKLSVALDMDLKVMLVEKELKEAENER